MKIRTGVRRAIMSILIIVGLLSFLTAFFTMKKIEDINYEDKKNLVISSITSVFEMYDKALLAYEKRYNIVINMMYEHFNNTTLPKLDNESVASLNKKLYDYFIHYEGVIPNFRLVLLSPDKQIVSSYNLDEEEKNGIVDFFFGLADKNKNERNINIFRIVSSEELKYLEKYAYKKLDSGHIFGVELYIPKTFSEKIFIMAKDSLMNKYPLIEDISIFNEDMLPVFKSKNLSGESDKKYITQALTELKNIELSPEKDLELLYIPIILKNEESKNISLNQTVFVLKAEFNKKNIYDEFRLFFYIFIPGIIISTFVGLLLAKKVTEPAIFSLEKLNTSIKSFRKDYTYLPPDEILQNKHTPDEIKSLASSFNGMVDETQAYLEELQSMNEDLESAFNEVESKNNALKEKNYLFSKQLSRIAEGYDDNTGKHIERVGEISSFIAQKLGMNDNFVFDIKYYSPLHDIGKLYVPTEILRKPGSLTEQEFAEIKKHTLFGSEIIGDSEDFRMAKNIALYHHEKFNGKGYPYGLSGDAIPIEAQIVSFADVYDALRSERPYKKSFSLEETFRIITKGDNRLSPNDFNPEIIKIFIDNKDEIDSIFKSLN